MWVGVGWNVVSIVLVGLTALLADNSQQNSAYNDPLFGVFLILCGALVQSLQYAFEERVMSMEIAAPPLLLIGMEGLWGTVVCLFVLYPLAYKLPGNDHGSIENPYNTYIMISNSKEIQNIFVLYFISIFLYNVLACLVTFMLNSVWHAILDNFRPISVWCTDLFIFYHITTSFGESWSKYSWIQLLGLFILLYGTAVYNAPNPGSIKLEGGCGSLFMDFSDEYAAQEEELEDAPAHVQHLTTMSPFMSPSMTRRNSGRDRPASSSSGYGTNNSGIAMQATKKQGSFA